MRWLAAVTQLGSVIGKSCKLVDLTTARAGLLGCFFLMHLNSDGAWSVIHNDLEIEEYIYIYFPDIK